MRPSRISGPSVRGMRMLGWRSDLERRLAMDRGYTGPDGLGHLVPLNGFQRCVFPFFLGRSGAALDGGAARLPVGCFSSSFGLA